MTTKQQLRAELRAHKKELANLKKQEKLIRKEIRESKTSDRNVAMELASINREFRNNERTIELTKSIKETKSTVNSLESSYVESYKIISTPSLLEKYLKKNSYSSVETIKSCMDEVLEQLVLEELYMKKLQCDMEDLDRPKKSKINFDADVDYEELEKLTEQKSKEILIKVSLGKETKYSKLYLNLIEKHNLSEHNSSISERHHILPRSLFPEFKNLNKNRWNQSNLPFRVHMICHIVLFKHYKSIKDKAAMEKMGRAVRLMIDTSPNSKKYSLVKKSIFSSLHLCVQERSEDIVKWNEEGMSMKEIAKKMNITGTRLKSGLKTMGIILKRNPNGPSILLDEEELRRVCSHMNMTQMVKHFGNDQATINKNLRWYKIAYKSPRKSKTLDIDVLRDQLLNKELRIGDIANYHKVSTDIIRKNIRDNNLAVNYKGSRKERRVSP